jgi:hypothetical protein
MTELKETLAASIQDMIYLDTKDVDLEPIKKKDVRRFKIVIKNEPLTAWTA